MVRNPAFDKVWSRRGADIKRYISNQSAPPIQPRSSIVPKPPRQQPTPLLQLFPRTLSLCNTCLSVFIRSSLSSSLRHRVTSINGSQSRQEYSVVCRLNFPPSCRSSRQRPLHSLLELFCEKLQTSQRSVLQLWDFDVIFFGYVVLVSLPPAAVGLLLTLG